jgi:hypothetical protein
MLGFRTHLKVLALGFGIGLLWVASLVLAFIVGAMSW